MKNFSLLLATAVSCLCLLSTKAETVSATQETQILNHSGICKIQLANPKINSTETQRHVISIPGRPQHPGSLDQGGETCEDAVVITSLPFCDTGTTVGYNDDQDPSGNCEATGGSPDVYYLYTPAANSSITVSLCGSDYDTYLEVWPMLAPCSFDLSPRCANNECGLQSCYEGIGVVAGFSYLIIVDGDNGESGNYLLNVTTDGICHDEPCGPLPGDWCENAITVDNLPFCASGSTIGYEDNQFETCIGGAGSPDICYVFTPTADVTATVSLCGSTFNTYLEISASSSPCAFDGSINCNDDACGSQSCIENLLFHADSVYLIVVDGNTEQGDFLLNITEDGICHDEPCGTSADGDDCNNPIVITELPVSFTGNTNFFLDDQSGCSGGEGAPDVVFSFSPAQSVMADLTTCFQTYFNSLLYVIVDGDVANPICGSNTCGSFDEAFHYNSTIYCFDFLAGHDYCIVLDGAAEGESGPFILNLDTTSAQECNTNDYCGLLRETEPNNSCESNEFDPHYFQCGDTLYGNICEAGDKDYFYVVTPEDVTSLIGLGAGENCDESFLGLGISFVFPPDHPLSCLEFPPCNDCGWVTGSCGPETTAVVVEGMGGCKTGTYKLVMTCDPAGNEECDPTACETANIITCDAQFDLNTCEGCNILCSYYRNGCGGQTQSAGIQQFLRIDVPQSANYTITVSTDSLAEWNQNVQFSVFTDCVLPKTSCVFSQDQNDYFTQVTGPRSMETGTVLLAPGTYYLAASISADFPYGTSCGDISVTVTCVPVLPCDPAESVVIYWNSATQQADITWTAPAAGDYQIFSTANAALFTLPPAAGWTLETTQNVPAGTNTWSDPSVAGLYKRYSLIHSCP